MQAQNEEMKALVMEQYNGMSVSMEEEKKAKLEQLYDKIVSFQENIDSAKSTLEITAREAETDARVSPADFFGSVVNSREGVCDKLFISPISHLRTFIQGNLRVALRHGCRTRTCCMKNVQLLWSESKQLWMQPCHWSWVPRVCWCSRTTPRPTLPAPTTLHNAKESQVGLSASVTLLMCGVLAVGNHAGVFDQCPKDPPCSPKSPAQPPAPASPSTGQSTLEMSSTASRSTAWSIHREVLSSFWKNVIDYRFFVD